LERVRAESESKDHLIEKMSNEARAAEERLSAEVKRLQRELESREMSSDANAEETASRIKTLLEENHRHGDRIVELERLLEERQSQITGLTQRREALEGEVAQLRQTIQTNGDQVKAATDQSQKQLEVSKKLIATLRAENTSLQTALSQLQETHNQTTE